MKYDLGLDWPFFAKIEQCLKLIAGLRKINQIFALEPTLDLFQLVFKFWPKTLASKVVSSVVRWCNPYQLWPEMLKSRSTLCLSDRAEEVSL